MIYVISQKNTYAAKRLASEARIKSCELRIMDITDLLACNFQLTPSLGDVLYIRNPYSGSKPDYLEKIIQLAQSFKAQGGRVVDDNITKGNLGKGKWEDYQKLMKAGLPIPKTWKYESRIMNYGFKLSTKHLALSPFILKWIYGLKAKGTFLIRKEADLENLPRYLPRNELMRQEYIEADREYKIITVGYKALPAILRFKFNKKSGRVDFSSARRVPVYGPFGLLKNRHATNLTQLAELASKTLGRELAKVDILEKAGKFYILEVNRFPGLKSFEKHAKHNIFAKFIEYLAALAHYGTA